MACERRSERLTVDRRVICNCLGQSVLLTMYDLSTDGCMIEVPGEGLLEGDELTVELFDGMVVGGTVVWHRQGHAGIAFAERLHPVVVQHLGFRQPGASFASKEPVDRFGNRLPGLVELDSTLSLLEARGSRRII